MQAQQCRMYAAGSCKFGNKCKFQHQTPTAQTPVQPKPAVSGSSPWGGIHPALGQTVVQNPSPQPPQNTSEKALPNQGSQKAPQNPQGSKPTQNSQGSPTSPKVSQNPQGPVPQTST